jgi:hypothetical protein
MINKVINTHIHTHRKPSTSSANSKGNRNRLGKIQLKLIERSGNAEMTERALFPKRSL